ncbi:MULTISPECIES: sulfur carrier protein ThiS [unclassified Agarivorans]|uniref:sulfur carrier protein ThiS n=1 Tax=unclassified Agarivorans TaxID=2636026 RepID=UPI003D7E7490
MYITIELNGLSTALVEPLNITQLLEQQQQSLNGVAVVVDGRIVPRTHWPVTQLVNGTKVRIFRAIAGG